MAAVLYAGSDRFRTVEADRTTWHAFSFGPHYDPGNVSFGPVTCLNDDHLDPHGGYPDHPHAHAEIVTWVLEGALRHTDQHGASTVLEAGSVLTQSAGAGLRHSEVADGVPTRFVQTWLRPDLPGGPPGRAHVRLPETGSGLHAVVGPGLLPVGVAGARLRLGRLGPGEQVDVPAGARHLLFVATGALRTASGAPVGEGSTVRVDRDGSDPLVAVSASAVLLWSLAD